MAESCELTTRLYVVWKTRVPLRNVPRRSRNFCLLGSEWNLELVFQEALHYYIIHLHNVVTKECLQETFQVTTFVQHPERDSKPVLSRLKTVSRSNEELWYGSVKSVSDCIQNFAEYGELKVVCLFHVDERRMFGSKNERMHLSTQTDSPLSSVEDISNLMETELSSNKCVQASLDIPSDLESLSLDLSNLLEHETFPDVKLKCGDRIFSAHKSILATRSQVFASMFRKKTTESETDVVDVTDLDAQVLDLFLKYAYSGKIPELSEDTAQSLYEAGGKYAVPSLKKQCFEWMVGGLSKGNCLHFLILADAHSDEKFKEIVENFVAENLEALNKETWSKFNGEHAKLANSVYQKRFAGMLSKQE